MPFQFVFVFLVQLLIFVIPGLFVLLQLGIALDMAFAFAIPFTVCLTSVLSVVLSVIGICGALPLLTATLSVPMALIFIGAITGRRCDQLLNIGLSNRPPESASYGSLVEFICFICFGLLAFTVLYTKNVSGFDGFVQFDDNATHLAVLETSANSGYFNALFPATSSPFIEHPVSLPAYYPGGYYVVPALSAAFTGVNSATVELASASIYCGIAYPAGWFAFSKLCCKKWSNISKFFIPVLMASTAFPLRMLIVHAPYPNIAGFALVPAFLSSVLFAFHSKSCHGSSRMVLCVACFLALAFLHPNALIFGVMAIFPFVLFNLVPSICEGCGHLKRPLLVCCVIDAALVVMALVIWVVLLQTDFMSNIVSFIWEWHALPQDVAFSIINGGLLLGIPQYLFGFFTMVGFFFLSREREARWIVVPFVLVSIQFILTGSGSNAVKSIFSGFWYTDPERLAAMLAIAMTPLAASGLHGTAVTLGKLSLGRARFIPHYAGLLLCVCFVAVNYFPYFLYSGSTNQTSFGQSFYEVDANTRKTEYSCYSIEEHEFVQKVKSIVQPEDLIINLPFDGSTFACSVDDLNVYYPYRTGSGESSVSKTIRTGLSRYSSDHDVREAVNSLGANYVMLLDRSAFVLQNEEGLMSAPGMNYYVGEWSGITSVDCQTPGFELIASMGDCQLYRIK